MKLTEFDIQMSTAHAMRSGVESPSNSDIALAWVRMHRNGLLENCDWEMTKALETGADATSLKTYRQALRDLPANSTPDLDDELNLTGVTWPTKPE